MEKKTIRWVHGFFPLSKNGIVMEWENCTLATTFLHTYTNFSIMYLVTNTVYCKNILPENLCVANERENFI